MKIYHITKFLKFQYSFSDILDYFRGTLRYKLYYTSSPIGSSLMRKHIREQIDYRIAVMDYECHINGECKICGCKTTHLQMANKVCEGDCYAPMMNKEVWKVVYFQAEYDYNFRKFETDDIYKRIKKKYHEYMERRKQGYRNS